MKTETTKQSRYSPLQAVTAKSLSEEKNNLQIVLKSDFDNHRFALHTNLDAHDATGWDCSWFTNYE